MALVERPLPARFSASFDAVATTEVATGAATAAVTVETAAAAGELLGHSCTIAPGTCSKRPGAALLS